MKKIYLLVLVFAFVGAMGQTLHLGVKLNIPAWQKLVTGYKPEIYLPNSDNTIVRLEGFKNDVKTQAVAVSPAFNIQYDLKVPVFFEANIYYLYHHNSVIYSAYSSSKQTKNFYVLNSFNYSYIAIELSAFYRAFHNRRVNLNLGVGSTVLSTFFKSNDMMISFYTTDLDIIEKNFDQLAANYNTMHMFGKAGFTLSNYQFHIGGDFLINLTNLDYNENHFYKNHIIVNLYFRYNFLSINSISAATRNKIRKKIRL